VSTPRLVYAKMDVTLDGSRKIRRAGRNGRDVFLWVLRQVSLRDTPGVIPAEDLEDYEWLADQLMCSESEAREGVAAAVRVRLIAIHDEECFVVGWDEEWGKRPMTGAERNARYKARRQTSPSDAPVTAGDGGDGAPKISPAAAMSAAACAEINRLTGSRYDPETETTLKLCRALVKAKYTPEQALLVIRDKHAEWAGDAKMRKHIVPATLLALANFAKYVDDLDSRPQSRDGPSGEGLSGVRAFLANPPLEF
jgi:uncharacterized phage protein (TIGR02220 family)